MAEAKRDSVDLTALIQLYRGEMARADAWRARLDTTTNWALTTTAAVISFGLGSATSRHAVILIGIGLVLNFLLIETRRYRAWDLFLRRVRLLETGVFAPLVRGEEIDVDELRELAVMLDGPRIVLPFWTALAQRIKRSYGPVLIVLLAAWLLKITAYPEHVRNFGELLARMSLNYVPGWVVGLVLLVVYLGLAALGIWGATAAPPQTELMPPKRRRKTLKAGLIRRNVPPPLRPKPVDNPLDA